MIQRGFVLFQDGMLMLMISWVEIYFSHVLGKSHGRKRMKRARGFFGFYTLIYSTLWAVSVYLGGEKMILEVFHRVESDGRVSLIIQKLAVLGGSTVLGFPLRELFIVPLLTEERTDLCS